MGVNLNEAEEMKKDVVSVTEQMTVEESVGAGAGNPNISTCMGGAWVEGEDGEMDPVGVVAGDVDGDDMMLADIVGGDLAMFSDDAFPSLPDFPCVSSSSCSSMANPNPPAACPPSSSSSSSSSPSNSWSTIRPHGKGLDMEPAPTAMDGDGPVHPAPPPMFLDSESSVDLLAEIENDDFWDHELLFPGDDDDGDIAVAGDGQPLRQEQEQQQQQQEAYLTQEEGQVTGDAMNGGASGGCAGAASEDMGAVFMEWLKSNKECISPEDLRSVKLKRSTIDSAARRLGGGKEGNKKLLKLILTWVQNHHLQKRRLGSGAAVPETTTVHFPSPAPQPQPQPQPLNSFPSHLHPNPSYSNPIPQSDPIPQYSTYCTSSPSSWCPHPCMAGGYLAGGPDVVSQSHSQPFSPPPSSFPVLDPVAAWPLPLPPPLSQPPQYSQYPPQMQPPCPGPYHNQFVHQTQTGPPLFTFAPSATKEARKKRMARQRRFSSLHRHHNHQSSSGGVSACSLHQQQIPNHGGSVSQSSSSGSWVVWPSPSSSSSQIAFTPESNPISMQQSQQQQQSFQRGNLPLERRQGWKTERNLRFLLQKVLKQSDVGNLGRIVLPKKEAETHLPELEARDGIAITMEDIGTSRIWNMRYRFWPNNKSRMYLLENTGEFVRSNGLREGDFIIIYSDAKCSKYMIRGVKVRQQNDSKQEAGSRHFAGRSSSSTAQRNVHNKTTASNRSSNKRVAAAAAPASSTTQR